MVKCGDTLFLPGVVAILPGQSNLPTMYDVPLPPPEGNRTSGNLHLLPGVAAPEFALRLWRAGQRD